MKHVRLIALDMDGTLLLGDHQTVPQRNIDAIRRANAAGIHVCICTGRMLEDASDFTHRLNLPCMLIACNGTRISDAPLPEGRVIYKRSLEPEDAKRAIDLLLPYHIMMNGFEDGRVTTIALAPGQHYHIADRALVEVRYGEEAMYAAAERGIMKLYLAEDGYAGAVDTENTRAARAAVQKALPHLQLTQSSPGNIEIMPENAGKGTALAFLANYLGFEREQVMAMGDAENDLSMLEYAYHSVAMANASPAVQKACRYQTLSNDECGVAAMIDRVLAMQER